MKNQRVSTGLGIIVLVIIAITVGAFAWKIIKGREVAEVPQNVAVQPKLVEKNQRKQNQSQNNKQQLKIVTPIDISSWKTYTNNDFNFTFKYPDGDNSAFLSVNSDTKSVVQNSQYGAQLLNIKEWDGGIQKKPEIFYFYINLIAAKDARGKNVTNVADFLKDYPLRRIHRIREERGYIDNISTIEDIWLTEDSGGIKGTSNESKTAYAYFNGLIYEITIISNSGIPANIMSTFHFLTSNN
jgi:hypothetical protein